MSDMHGDIVGRDQYDSDDMQLSQAHEHSVIQNTSHRMDSGLVIAFCVMMMASVATLLIVLAWASVFIVNPIVAEHKENSKLQREATMANTAAIDSMLQQNREFSVAIAVHAESTRKISQWVEEHVEARTKANTDAALFLKAMQSHNYKREQRIYELESKALDEREAKLANKTADTASETAVKTPDNTDK